MEALRCRSKKRAHAPRRRDPREGDSRMGLVALVSGAVVFMDHAEFLSQPKQTFGVSHEEISGGIQAMPKLFDQALLFGFVEVDHHVAAENNVVAARQEFRFQVVKVKLHELLQLRLDGVLVAGLFEITKPAGVIHRFHLLLGIEAFLADAQAGIADVRGNDFHFPWRRNERLRWRHFERKRIPQGVIRARVTDQNGDSVGLLAGGATSTPDPERVIAALLLAAQNLLENGFLKEIELRAIAKETRFVDGQILKQESQCRASLPAGQQPVISIEGVEPADFQTALQAIFQEVRAALIEKHAAFLIDQRLEKLQLCFGELDLGGNRSHCVFVKRTRNPAWLIASRKKHYLAVATGSAASSSRLYSGRCKSLEMSSRIMRRPFSLPTPVRYPDSPSAKTLPGASISEGGILSTSEAAFTMRPINLLLSSTTRMRFFLSG